MTEAEVYALSSHTKRVVFVVVTTPRGRGAISVQDAPARKLNKHWKGSFRRAAWPKQTAAERRKVENKEGAEKSQMASELVTVKSEREPGLLLSPTLMESRDARR